MANFTYIDKSGRSQAFDAPDSATALRTAPNIASDSGVMVTSPGSRNLNLTAGNPVGQIQQGQVQSQAVGNTAGTGVDKFNSAIMGLLQKYQQLGTKGFVTQGQDAQTEQNNRISAPTDPSLIGASPTVQNSVRTNSANALDPTIKSASDSAQTFGEQIKSFGGAVDNVRTMLKDYEDTQNKTRDDARSVIKDALTMGGADALSQLKPDEITKLEKTAGYPAGYIHGLSQTIKERELQLKQASGGSSSDTTDIKNYKFAQQNGYTGSFTDYISGNGSSGPKSIFTKTQTNKGANNAGLALDDFKGLDGDVQNFYISSTATQLKGMNSEIDAVKSGSKSPDEVKALIDSSNNTDAVKEYLKGLVDSVTPQKKPGLLDRTASAVYNGVNSIFGK